MHINKNAHLGDLSNVSCVRVCARIANEQLVCVNVCGCAMRRGIKV